MVKFIYMPPLIKKLVLGFSTVVLANAPSYEVSLFTGINRLVKLGDPLSITRKQNPQGSEKISVSDTDELKSLKIEEGLSYPGMGLKIYYRHSGAALIILQEPFSGKIRSKKIALFPFGPSPLGTWEEYLIKELGIPDFTVTGGRLNSKALFYSWGDISFNAMGPNQLALYRDSKIAKYREKNFGRELQILPKTEAAGDAQESN
ncbi:MAG: hypothetical protein EBQ92_11245 [Proteobacteria bacterium]|nr:hypothetical protein [Pseudomonadota bacterium]